MKKTVFRVNNNFEYDFILIGIVSQQVDFRLCREINLVLDLKLYRKDDFLVFNQKRMEEQQFAFFEHISDTENRYNLISNKTNTAVLLSEKSQIDYLFIVHPGALPVDENELLSKIKKVKFVLGAYKLVPAKLKSRENLIF